MTNAGKCLKILQSRWDVKSIDLAEKLGTTPQQILRFRRQENMKLHVAQQICSVVGITLNEFCDLENK